MNCLFLDLASHDSFIACVNDTSVVASESVSARIGDHELIPMVESILMKAGWSYSDIDRIACVIGPGGFTSLRVAVTYTNVLADQLGVPEAGVHLSDLYGVRAWGVGRRMWESTYWLHSTKKDQLFVRGGTRKEPTLVAISALPPIPDAQHPISWMGELIPEHRDLVQSEPIPLKPLDAVLPAFLSAQSYKVGILSPWYGRGW